MLKYKYFHSPEYGRMLSSLCYLIWFILAGQLRRNSLTLWVSLVLSGMVVLWVSIETQRERWDLRHRRVSKGGPTYGQIMDREIMEQAYFVLSSAFPFGTACAPSFLIATSTVRHNSVQSQWGFMYYSYWVIFNIYLAFLMPILTLSCINTLVDPENDAWVWLWSRPLPRSGIYLAQWIGTLPWVFILNIGTLAALAIAGGSYGQKSLFLYTPFLALGILSFTSLFHFIHIFFHKPIVVGLLYVFFYETLTGGLPGSIKLLSLTFHIRSLLYNVAQADRNPVQLLLLSEVASWETAMSFLLSATLILTLLGAWLFGKYERKEIT